ncbi:D-aminoacyl-tRNA deacylase [Oceanivirga miroungae]|uniref:D-tyrosyl-tRNA(Tyr) deacylase n=1 Tax=Oceanivirga miroungae TaxID=1130046 RepID=A0A6I8ME69_9FUSO|nr:D-aminoacyl-tRNA deacylase [Oceanivirga miroungae]VWL85765.1 D-tyrosyl-tRNA(Tyr) deacylase [Oceanivirga miroungae]
MKLLVSRVKYADILIDNKIKRTIQKGILVYVGFSIEDEKIDEKVIDKSINKILSLRFFEDESGKLKKNVVEENKEIMIVSNFSLYARNKKGTSLDFTKSLNSESAKLIYDKFLKELKNRYEKVVSGEFKSDMQITSLADGPLNVILEY